MYTSQGDGAGRRVKVEGCKVARDPRQPLEAVPDRSIFAGAFILGYLDVGTKPIIRISEDIRQIYGLFRLYKIDSFK